MSWVIFSFGQTTCRKWWNIGSNWRLGRSRPLFRLVDLKRNEVVVTRLWSWTRISVTSICIALDIDALLLQVVKYSHTESLHTKSWVTHRHQSSSTTLPLSNVRFSVTLSKLENREARSEFRCAVGSSPSATVFLRFRKLAMLS